MKSVRAFIHPLFLASALCLAGAATPSFAQGDDSTVSEMEQRHQISEHARHLLLERKFSELEAQAADFRTNQVRLPSGFWKLYNFYEGVQEPASGASGANWEAHLGLLEEWRSAFPKSATAATALAAAYAEYAWKARGTGYADSVTEEGWELFRQRLDKSQQIIENAFAASLDDPHLNFVYLLVGKGQSWPPHKHKRAFADAVKKHPCYDYCYFQRANYLLPRWHGEPGDVERFAEQSISLYDGCEGKGIYARLAVYLMGYRGDRNAWLFDTFALSWPKVREGFEDLEKQYPHSLWNLNQFCKLACHAGDRPTAVALFKRIGDRWDGSVWTNEGKYRQWKNWAENPGAHGNESGEATEDVPLWKRVIRRLLDW